MKVEYCYNYNEASGSRGLDPDVPNETSSFEAASVEEAVKGIYEDLFGFDNLEDLDYATEGDYTPEYLVQYAEDQDVTGGDTILFWFAIDGQCYETQWMDCIEEFYNDEEDDLLESKKKTNKNKLTEDDTINRIQNIFNVGDVFVNERGVEISVFDVGENDVSYKVMSPGKSYPDTYCTDKDSLYNCLNQNHYKIREKRTVKVTFQDDKDADSFKDEMKKKFEFPKVQSKHEVIHGKSKSGGSVFVEKKLREAGASFGRVIESRKNVRKRIDEDAGEKLNQIFQKGDLYINPNDVEVSVVDVGDNDVTYKTKIPGNPIEDAFCSNQSSAMNFLTANGYVKQLPQDNAAEAEQEEVTVVESAKKKNRKLKEDTRFVDSASWIEDNISDDDFEDFADFCDDVYGVDFTYEDPNALWSISELNEMKRAWLEEMGGDVDMDPEMSLEGNEDESLNIELAYNDWLSLEGSDPDVSNFDAFMAGAALSNVVVTEDQYSEWLEQYAPDYAVSNYDAFEAGAKLGYEDSAIDDFSAATPYKERTITESRKKVNEADISKVKKFNTPYFEKLCYKVFEVMNAYEGETPEYDAYNSLYSILGYVGQYLNTNHETSWGLKGVRARLYRLVNDPVDYFGLSANNGAEGFSEEFFQSCYEEGIIPFIREYVTDPQLIEALDYVENTVVANIDVEKANKYNARLKAERDALQAKNAAEAAKRDEESKFLVDAAKKANVTIDEVEFFESISEWSVVLGTEDEDDANDFRNEVGEILGAENTLGASYDDIQGMADIHLGCLQYYEWSEMNGGDVYEDLREDLRDKYVVFACPKQDWVEYRHQNDW